MASSTHTPRRRREPIRLRADRPHIDTLRCTYIGTYSLGQCMHTAEPGSDRCNLPGHERSAAA